MLKGEIHINHQQIDWYKINTLKYEAAQLYAAEWCNQLGNGASEPQDGWGRPPFSAVLPCPAGVSLFVCCVCLLQIGLFVHCLFMLCLFDCMLSWGSRRLLRKASFLSCLGSWTCASYSCLFICCICLLGLFVLPCVCMLCLFDCMLCCVLLLL